MARPTRPGFYWARWLTPAEGTHEGEELTPAQEWEIVQVEENFIGEPCEADRCEKFLVAVPGVRETQWLDNFEWGEGPIEQSSGLSKEELTERFYSVREQRNKLLWSCKKALAAYDRANKTGKGNWKGKDVDEMRAVVATVKESFKAPAKAPDTKITCPDCGEVDVVSDVFEHGRGISGECPKCHYRLYYAPPIEEVDREKIAEG